MRVLVSGSTGLIGTACVSALETAGHDVVKLVRRAAADESEIRWNPTAGEPWVHLPSIDCTVHLSGAPVGPRPWTRAYRKRLWESRVASTNKLVNSLAKLDRQPRTLICASAIGYYGDCGDDGLDESSKAGTGFLSDLTVAWEAASLAAAEFGIRVVNIRSGHVLARDAGYLRYLSLPAKLGFVPKLGSGRQYQSWIHVADEASAIVHLIENHEVSGPVNLTGPQPVRQETLARELAGKLGVKVVGIPTALLSLGAGRTRTIDALNSSQRVFPKALLDSGFGFRAPDLATALEMLFD